MKVLFLLIVFYLFPFLCLSQEHKYPYNSFRERDPLRPLVNDRGEILIKEKKGVGDFFLQGIIYYPEGNRAIINNQIFIVGDAIEGYRIKKIDAYRVILEKEGKEFILKWEGVR